MTILIILLAMVVVGIIMGVIAGLIWKDNRPIGVWGDYIVAVISTIVIGLMDWYIIPAMGFSTTLRDIALFFEPALGALLILWLIRRARP